MQDYKYNDLFHVESTDDRKRSVESTTYTKEGEYIKQVGLLCR